MFEIQFFTEELDFLLESQHMYKSWIQNCLISEGIKECEINYIFCSDEYLHEINTRYLDHDTYTDIITFPMEITETSIQSDIFISIERIRENAKLYSKSFVNELSRVIIHGVLHLVGFDDKAIEDKQLMREKEDYYLSLLP